MLLLAETMSVGGFFSALWKCIVGLFGFALEHPIMVGLFIFLCIGFSRIKGDPNHDSSQDFVD